MKKLLSILLALVMVFTLTVPALAAGRTPEDAIESIGGADGPTAIIVSPAPEVPADFANWADEWAETCEKFPEETAQFLQELPVWFAENYPEFDSFEEYCAYCESVEEAYVELYDFWSWNHEQERAKNEFITTHGGVPGQINVMLNGQYVKFPDAVPEISEGRTMVPFRAILETLGAEITFDEGKIHATLGDTALDLTVGSEAMTKTVDGKTETVQMDCAPYVKDGRTYIPLRFISEALGYDVQWDDYYRSAVITDLEGLAAEIDKDFTIYNKLVSRNALTDKTQKSVGSGRADVTLFDTLDGDKTSQATYSYDLAASTAGASGKIEYDLSELWELVEGYIPMPLDDYDYGYDYAGEYAQTLELIRSLMKGSLEVRVDLENEKVYLSMPGLFEALGGSVEIPKDAWVSAGFSDGTTPDLTGMVSQPLTMGKLLTSIGSSMTGSNAHNYASILETAELFGKLYGDSQFTRKGDADVMTLTKRDLAALIETTTGYTGEDLDALSKFDYTVTFYDNGDVDVSGQARVALADSEINLGDFVEVTVEGSTRDGKSESTVEVHVKNVLKATVTLEETLTETDEAPETNPPSDAMVIPLDGELPSGMVVSPDGPTLVLP